MDDQDLAERAQQVVVVSLVGWLENLPSVTHQIVDRIKETDASVESLNELEKELLDNLAVVRELRRLQTHRKLQAEERRFARAMGRRKKK